MKQIKSGFSKQENLQAVEGKPPNTEIGWVGAVGHIHLICTSQPKCYMKV